MAQCLSIVEGTLGELETIGTASKWSNAIHRRYTIREFESVDQFKCLALPITFDLCPAFFSFAISQAASVVRAYAQKIGHVSLTFLDHRDIIISNMLMMTSNAFDAVLVPITANKDRFLVSSTVYSTRKPYSKPLKKPQNIENGRIASQQGEKELQRARRFECHQ